MRGLRGLRFGWLVCLMAMVCGSAAWAASENQALDTGWQFRQASDTNGKPIQSQWLPAVAPGDVHLDLLRNKKIPEPFYGDNESKLQWIENADWEYRAVVPVRGQLLNHSNVELVFDGLDTCAEVYLNGNLVLTSNNMFRTYRVNAKPYLKPGDNQLRIMFPSPIRCAAKYAAADPWRKDEHVAEKWYIRKAAYEYGWDWAPRYVTSGVWLQARLEAWDTARVSDLYAQQLDVTKDVAHVLAQVEVTAAEDTAAQVDVSYLVNGRPVHAVEHTHLHAGVNHVDVPFTIEHPELWYPAGYGAQPIYTFRAEVSTKNGVESTREVKTGIRSAVLRRDPDQWGRSFEFVVNGIPVFAKGANVVPFDSFPSRVTKEQMRDILQSAKDANMNMVRVWGGGYYPPDDFFELCDELGIMVWQDFMFGNPWQPGSYAFKQNVKQEVEEQIIRLRNHPSLVLWCGNNEQESNFTQDTNDVSVTAKVQMWQDYLTEFSGIIPTAVAQYAPNTAYWPSTPSADYEETKDRNYMELEDGDDAAGNYESGDAHDYSIWDSPSTLPKREFSTEEDRHYRFVSEYGFQAFPDIKTVDAYTSPADRNNLSNAAMMNHQKAVAGPGTVNGYPTIHAYMKQYYGEPKDLFMLVYASQVLQADGIKVIAEHLRRDRPWTMGSLFWQLNDCWPVVSSASIDYYGRWKALQYYARRFYAPVLVSSRVKDGRLVVRVVSDKTQPVTGVLRLRVMKFDGTVIDEKSQTITVQPLSSQVFGELPVASVTTEKNLNPTDVVAAMDLKVGNETVSSNLMYFAESKNVLQHMPAAHVEAKLTGGNGVYRLRLSSPVLARSVYVSFAKADPKMSDNYVDLLPGEPMEITLHSQEPLDVLRQQMRVTSLTDAFVKPGEKGFNWE